MQNQTTKELKVTAIGDKGEGMASIGGARIFVPYTLPGELVCAVVDGQRANVLDIVEPSPRRVTPPCAHFGSCGGCQLQHWETNAYRTWKRDLVIKQLQRAEIETEIRPIVDAHGQGRRRATLHATGTQAGFLTWRSHELHALDKCPILVPALDAAPQIAIACAQIAGPCDVAFTVSDTGLDVAVRTKSKSRGRPDFAPLVRRFDLARIAINGEIAILRRQPVLILGTAIVELPVSGFLQATTLGEHTLAQLVCEALGKAKRTADLFCGLGPFALRIAEKSQVFAVDSDRHAVAACDAALQSTPGLKRIGTDVRDLFRDPLIVSELARFNAVVVDPPRAGAQAQMRELANSQVKKIVAVSCNLTSFARDARILIEGGYTLDWVAPVDQFLWSAHVELVARFSR